MQQFVKTRELGREIFGRLRWDLATDKECACVPDQHVHVGNEFNRCAAAVACLEVAKACRGAAQGLLSPIRQRGKQMSKNVTRFVHGDTRETGVRPIFPLPFPAHADDTVFDAILTNVDSDALAPARSSSNAATKGPRINN